jgi:pSer/pThr/pTyr-binding forkhead associated (FHA) protein
MPYIQFEDNQFPLRAGEMSIGTGTGSEIRLEGPEQLGVQAIVQLGADNHVAIRRQGNTAVVRVNGVQLGAEPTPLIHGDKIEIAGHELQFGDDRKGGSTQLLSDLNIPALQAARAASPARPTAATGGRLVSLVDGREYPVPGTGLTIGREAGCDVVVPSNEVSRRHAELAPSGEGYVVSDLSTNGVFVNGARIQSAQILGRGDIVRIGNEEFRFYADVAPVEGAAAPAPVLPPAAAPAAAKAAAPAPAPAASSGAVAAGPKTTAPKMATPAAAPRAAAATPQAASAATPATGAAVRPPLATLEVMNEGVLKGHRYELRQPLVHVGRGAHNDVMVSDDSVSDAHAKIQKREGGWFIVDMGSTNGTYVAGRRIEGESRLSAGGEVLRFGGIKMNFRPAMEGVEDAKGTRAITGVNVDQARRMAASAAASRVSIEAEEAAAESRGLPAWLWVVVLLLVGAGAFFILQGRP